jgi:hypothetical protein
MFTTLKGGALSTPTLSFNGRNTASSSAAGHELATVRA